MEDHLIDNELNDAPKDVIFEILGWWEKKRLLFNLIILGMVGLAAIPYIVYYSFGSSRVFSGAFLIQSILYFIFINAAYCAGWGIQCLRYYYSKTQPESDVLNFILFTLGTLFTAFVTYFGYSSWL